MNAILSLCHFCELHGPRIIFNTQAFKDVATFEKIIDGSEKEFLNKPKDICESQNEDNGWKYGSSTLYKENVKSSLPLYTSETCAACRTFPHNKAGLVCNDDSNEVSYVSSQYPLQQELFALVRQACIRSLSCEVCSEKDGPIYFGDDVRGHVISYTFFLKDVQARGFQRWYSILIVMKDKMFLLSLWPFFTKFVGEFIKNLQKNSFKVYSNETEESSSHSKGMRHITYDTMKRSRGSGPPRQLRDIVGEVNIWVRMHQTFTWVLKASGMKMKEKMRKEKAFSLEDPMNKCTQKLSSFYSMLGPLNFSKLIHYLYVGKKVLLKAHSLEEVESFLGPLKTLLPAPLYNPAYFSDDNVSIDENSNIIYTIHPTYYEPKENNVIVLSLSPERRRTSIAVEGSHKLRRCSMSEEALFSKVTVFEAFILQSRQPQLVSRISNLFASPLIAPNVLQLYVQTLLDDWMSKAKLWSILRQSRLTMRNAASTPSFTMLYRSAINSYYPHTQSSPAVTLACQLAVGALECDVPLLDAWGKALMST